VATLAGPKGKYNPDRTAVRPPALQDFGVGLIARLSTVTCTAWSSAGRRRRFLPCSDT